MDSHLMTPRSNPGSSSAPLKKRMNSLFLSHNTASDASAPPALPSPTTRDNEQQAAAAALASLGCKPSPPPSPSEKLQSPVTVNSPSNNSASSSAPSTPSASASNSSLSSGYLSSSDSSTASSNSPLPRPVHAPPVSSMMVDHTYRDYSCVDESLLETLDAAAEGEEIPTDDSLSPEESKVRERKLRRIKNMFTDAGNVRKNSGGVTKPFPEKLMEVLSRGDIDTIIQWLPHGRAFIVLNPQLFLKEVLPRFFKQSKFMSFTRQLNLWGFKRITKGRDAGAYYHQLFLRGRPRLCMRMRRQKIKGTGIKLTPNPETEPNFYKISEKAPLPAMDPKKKYEPLPPLRKVGNTPSAPSQNAPGAARPTSHGTGNMNLPFEYANLLNGGRNVNAMPSSNPAVSRPPMNNLPPGMSAAGPRRPAPPMSNLMMPNMTMSHQEEHRRLSNGSAGSNLSRMEMLSPSHDRSGSAMRPRFNNAAPPAVSNPHALLQDIRGLEMSSTADQRLSAAQELEVLAQALREKAAAEKQQQTIVAAQRLLNQMSDPRKPNSPRSVEQLKSHLLAAAHSLDTVSAPMEPREAAHARYNQLSAPPRRSAAPMDPYNSLVPQSAPSHRASTGGHSNLDPLMNQIPTALMNALDQTKMVAAAAQEQSALLQRFAQNLEMRRGSNGNTAEQAHGMYNPHGRNHM